MHASANFILRGGDAAFANRQKSLFDHLSVAESKCVKHDRSEADDSMEMDENDKSPTSNNDRKRKRETKKFRGKESIFKRPEGPAPRTNVRNIPDYHKNPHKWIKYSLEDVSNEDMSECSNTQAAMSFLRELKAHKIKEAEDQEKMDVDSSESDLQDSTETRFKTNELTSTSKIIFKKPQTKDEADNSEAATKPVYKNNKIIMPEYVVGQKPKKISKQNRHVVEVQKNSDYRSKELRLNHLHESDEEEEENSK
ncbi:protein TSSC4 [Pseudomyrmex gracilis]|uniref:protein TSSC4 n=1 Tax=Pseudomyrmex gracilis TaxID=219809 RepID=UPI000995D45D|nr:protein TSSC4 [Pseudomyrmex gracilis]